MPSTQLANPGGVFGQSAAYDQVIEEYVANGTITAGLVVAPVLSGSIYEAEACPLGSPNLAIGVALDSVVAGQVVRVCTRGIANVLVATGGVTAGNVAAVGVANGEITSASATIGSNIGLVLATTTAGNLAPVYVSKM